MENGIDQDGSNQVVDGIQDEPSSTQSGPTLADFQAQIQQLTEAYRISQGASDRTQNEIAQLRGMIQGIASTQPASRQDATPEEFAELDMTDPAIKTLVTAYKRMETRLAQVSGQQAVIARSAEEQASRDYTIAELAEKAEDNGLDFAAIRPSLNNLPTAELWAKGKEIIKEAKKTVKRQPANASDDVVNDAVSKRLLEMGIFSETRGATGVSKNADAVDSLNDRFNQGKIAFEEYSKQLAALTG